MSGDYVSDWTAMLELRTVPHYSRINSSPLGQKTQTNGSLIKFLLQLLLQIVSVSNAAERLVWYNTNRWCYSDGLSVGRKKYVRESGAFWFGV